MRLRESHLGIGIPRLSLGEGVGDPIQTLTLRCSAKLLKYRALKALNPQTQRQLLFLSFFSSVLSLPFTISLLSSQSISSLHLISTFAAMPFTALLHSLASALEMLVLSWTSHARLMKAEHPFDFDLILKRTIREVKFHSETVSRNT